MVRLVTILFVLVVVGGFLYFKFHNTLLGLHTVAVPKIAVKGVSTNVFSPQIQSTLGLLQQQVAHLSSKDISSTSPQIQAILKTLQSLPAGEARDVCQKLCGNYLK